MQKQREGSNSVQDDRWQYIRYSRSLGLSDSPMLNDTDILSGVYCHFIVNAPRYSVDFSNRQKQVAEQKFVKAFVAKGIEYPVGGFTRSIKITLLRGLLPNTRRVPTLIKSASGLTNIASKERDYSVCILIIGG